MTFNIRTEALKYPSADEFIAALRSQKRLVYHGTPNQFDKFSYDFIKSTNEGKGFYFTDDIDVARGYSRDSSGRIISAYIDIRKPLSLTKKTISTMDLKKLLRKVDPTGQGILSNYGDYTYDGYEKVLNLAAKLEMEGNDNDVDLVSSIINGGYGGRPDSFYTVLKETLGYDGIIADNPEWGHDGKKQVITIAFFDDQILNESRLRKLHAAEAGDKIEDKREDLLPPIPNKKRRTRSQNRRSETSPSGFGGIR